MGLYCLTTTGVSAEIYVRLSARADRADISVAKYTSAERVFLNACQSLIFSLRQIKSGTYQQ